ncbi:craniofacial development protein 2-like [Acyrthosiphon pisum]|uniref:Endonuclease/exonuclease/phosphatase domain-containing protein n=1 Tax=Acyrthosiphon pisum TaxID=7029 RepID=A0A8R2B216_ACYPI|nr:craniofacial development protein 2-like [Acyrthosiphon pisum]|eukprot:XP_008180216.1 PREDICTED: craniofacial development protein 2-like [Acyrthosiphon pisum]
MDKMKVDILGKSEMRWPKSGDFWSGDHRIIYTGASEKKPGTGGVGIIMNKTLGKKVKGYIQYDDRIILVKFQTKPKDTIVVQVYMLTSNSNDEEVEEVYENIDKIIENVKGEENLVVMGDWNAVVGEEKVNNVTGTYGLGKRNERGERLLEFCAKHNLIITNTCFDHHRRRRYTWKMPGYINRYQIDYIMVKNRFKNQVKESRSYPGADIDSDHNLVMMKCELKFKRIMGKKKEIAQWKIKNLRDGKISKKYNEDTNGVIIEESQNIKERWQNLKDTITLAATTTLGNSNNTTRKEWITMEIVNMIEERRKYKSSSSIDGQEKYRVLRNLIIRKSREAKEKYLEEKCSEIETLMKTGSSDEAYRMVKMFFGQHKPRAGGIEDNNGRML